MGRERGNWKGERGNRRQERIMDREKKGETFIIFNGYTE